MRTPMAISGHCKWPDYADPARSHRSCHKPGCTCSCHERAKDPSINDVGGDTL